MSQAFSRERQSVIDSELRHGMRQPTPTWAMASPSGRAVRAVRAIRAPTPAPMPAHQEYYDTEPDSDQDQDQNQDRDQNQDQVHLAGDGDEPEGYDMMEDNPPPLGPSPRAVHVAAPAGIPPAPALPAPPVNAVQAEQAEEDVNMRVLQLESQLATANLALARAQRELAERDARARRARREAKLLQSAAAGRHWTNKKRT